MASGSPAFHRSLRRTNMWAFPSVRGTFLGRGLGFSLGFRGPHNKDYEVLGSILRSPYPLKFMFLEPQTAIKMVGADGCAERVSDDREDVREVMMRALGTIASLTPTAK